MSPRRFWACHGQDCKGKPCGYQVPVGKTYCDACGHQPPAHVSCPEKAKPPGKGGGKGAADGKPPGKGGGKGRANGKPPNTGRGSGNTLEKQLKAAAAELQKSNKEKLALGAEVKRLKEGAAARPPPAAEPSMELDHDGTDAGTSALEAAISAARAGLKQTQALTDFQKSLLPDYAATLAAAQAKLEAALVARRAASPLKKQLEGAEGHQQRSSKKVADATALLETRRKEAADAQFVVQLQEKALDDLRTVLVKADAQVADLAARFALEYNATAPVAVAVSEKAEVTRDEMDLILRTWKLVPPEALKAACGGNDEKATQLLAAAAAVQAKFHASGAGREAVEQPATCDDKHMELGEALDEHIIPLLEPLEDDKEPEKLAKRVEAFKERAKRSGTATLLVKKAIGKR